MTRRGELPGLDVLRPHAVVALTDPGLGELGVLVLDRFVHGAPSGGGIRSARDLTVEEVAECARAMTLKWSFLNFAHGGAKVGVTAPADLLAGDRRGVMAALGRALRPFVRRGLYFTGTDLGSTLADLTLVREAIGLTPPRTDGGAATARTVFEAMRVAARHLGMPLADASIAIEGFGKVGSALGTLLGAAGARVVAISTWEGAVHDPAGIDLSVAERGSIAAAAATSSTATSIRPHELFALDVDVLVPGARTWVLDAATAATVRARLVLPISNAPATRAGEDVLASRGSLLVPDFVANVGGVFWGQAVGRGYRPRDVEALISGPFATKVARLLQRADAEGRTPSELARELAWANFERINAVRARSRGRSRVRRRVEVVRRDFPRGVLEELRARSYLRGRLRTEGARIAAVRRLGAQLVHEDR